jgi:anti-sigma factor RsiW
MCDDREKLIAYLYDEADASERRQVDAHLAGCAECRDELRSLRGVRQDLLAWDVPPHESVWKPFVTPVVTPWYRQVPVWGLAAAATLVFGLGLAGGFAARALASGPVVMQAQAQPQAAPTPVPVSAIFADEVRALEERLTSIERAALSRPGATPVSSVSLTRSDLEQLLRETEGRINERTARKLVSMMVDMEKQRSRDMLAVTQQINEAQQSNYATLSRVATRGTLEKEKEQ